MSEIGLIFNFLDSWIGVARDMKYTDETNCGNYDKCATVE